MSSLELCFLSLGLFGTFLSMVLYVFFGQFTVKKLRKNPETRNSLGIEFASGWDIVNVAQALAIPRFLTKKLEQSPLASLYANSERLRKNTTRFDRILAATFYWVFTASGITLITLVVLNGLGVFD